uniref:Golgi-associated plant pathogenesis-related protein 1-like n=1 Tax=Monopterus albus TaxID=43700 RepID=UPI0009B3F503|nr:Golgi-associated plant pathogenesis-related protein 1-like [Monopterus albus]
MKKERAKHHVPPLELSSELNASAQNWANYLLAIGALQHSHSGTGENIFCTYGSSRQLTGKEAVDAWYREIKDYSWHMPGFRMNTGHFTQVVWKDSTELGVGLATDGHRAFVVGQYLPPGNMNTPGHFQRDVLPPDSRKDLNKAENHM